MSNFNQLGKPLPSVVPTNSDSEPIFLQNLESSDTSSTQNPPIGYPASYSMDMTTSNVPPMDMMGTEEVDINKILEEIFSKSENMPMPEDTKPEEAKPEEAKPEEAKPEENLFAEYLEGYIDYPSTTPKPLPPIYPSTTPKPLPPIYPTDTPTNNFLDSIDQIIASFATGTPIIDFLSDALKFIKPIVLDTKESILSIAEETIDTTGNISQNLATGTPILDLATNVVSKIKGGIVGGIKGFFKGIKES